MILYADRILAGDRTTVWEDRAVCVQDGVIRQIGSLAQLQAAYPEEPVETFPGCTLMPGMIDLHVHLACTSEPDYHNPYNGVSLRALYAAGRMRATLAAGVTTVRDCGSADGIGPALKRAAADGHIPAPRIFTCLQGICMTGGHGSDALPGGVIEADGVDEVRRAVRRNLKHGADCIKVLTSEGFRGEELSQEELNAIVREAHRFGRKAAAHAGYGRSLDMCIEAGFDSIEHGTHLTVEQARRMREKGITWVPTVLVFHYVRENAEEQQETEQAILHRLQEKAPSPPRFLQEKPEVDAYLSSCLEAYRQNFRSLYDTGVRVATGTDTDCTDFGGASPVALECTYMVRCGLKPLEAIECATKNAADHLGLGDRLGQVREGYLADLLLVKGDPAWEITALWDVAAVYQAGRRVV